MKGGSYVGCCVPLMLSGAAGAVPVGVAMRDAEADRILTEKLNKDLVRMKRLNRQSGAMLGKATIELTNCAIRVDLPAAFLPERDSHDFQQQILDIGTSLWWESRKLGCEGSVRIFIDGKPSERHFPDTNFVDSSLQPRGVPQGFTLPSAVMQWGSTQVLTQATVRFQSGQESVAHEGAAAVAQGVALDDGDVLQVREKTVNGHAAQDRAVVGRRRRQC